MAFKFRGGIHPNDQKAATNKKAIEKVKAPEFVYIPVSMHIGAPCSPIVKVGEEVTVGQKIGDTEAFVSAPIHASISGTVTAVAPRIHASGAEVMTVTIKNDFQDTPFIGNQPMNYEEMTAEEIVKAIREAGIVGHGGAAFPTHIKISSGIGKVETIIINGAECEPYITSDHRLMLEHPDMLIGGLKVLEKAFGVSNIKIGVEENKKDAFEGIRQAIVDANSPAELVPLHTRFPQGAEKQLIYAITKRETPSGKLPSDVGCAVFNIDTVIAIYTLFTKGTPDIRRIVTISGSAIANPKNLYTPIGTPISHLIEACGGFKEEPTKLIMGGPMMGHAQFTTDVPVMRGTNAFLAFCGKEDKRVKNPACLRCGKCVGVCPMGLSPVYMNLYASKDRITEFAEIGGMDCMECGSCAYTCPARIQLVQSFRTAKQKVMNSRRK
ncbi:MAG: electron transport complex subunit RsxC [Clostridia bacterium]